MDEIERFIRYYVTADDVVVDIGANRGAYAKVFAELAQQVYCLEPNPTIFPILRENIRDPKVKLLQLAASDRQGTIDFYLDKRPEMYGVASSVNLLADLHAANMVQKISVQATTLDDLCEAHGIVPSFVKVDVEGHEPALFRGARQVIAKYRPVFVFEFWETWWDNGFSDLFAELEPYYHLIRIQDGANASHVYRTTKGDKGADIAAVPRRTPGTVRASIPSAPPRGRARWFQRRRLPAGIR